MLVLIDYMLRKIVKRLLSVRPLPRQALTWLISPQRSFRGRWVALPADRKCLRAMLPTSARAVCVRAKNGRRTSEVYPQKKAE